MSEKSLGDRCKEYEEASKFRLTKRLPMIIRIDGRAFHTWTRGLTKPFSEELMKCLIDTTFLTCEEISGAKFAYLFSDEISILVTDYDELTTQAWFDKEVQKLCSVTASIFTANFNNLAMKLSGRPATFDARCFVLPKEEVCNYFLWRQQDSVRNSVSALAQAHFSHKELQNKNSNEMQEMLFQSHGINWNNIDVWKRRGACVLKTDTSYIADCNPPIFSQDRNYIERFVFLEDKESE